MPHLVYIIDSNTAVQAIAALAISSLKMDVKQITVGEKATQNLAHDLPSIIICSHEMLGLEPIALCRKLKQERLQSKSPPIYFILLVSSEMFDAVSPTATQAGVDAVLPKPFRSEQLKELVENLLAHTPEHVENHLLFSDELLIGELLIRFLKHYNFDITSVNSISQFEKKLSQKPSGTLFFHDSGGHQKIVEKLSKISNPVVIIGSHSSSKINNLKKKEILYISRPLTYRTIVQKLLPFLGLEEKKTSQLRPLYKKERTALAALLTSTVFDELLRSQKLIEREWNQVADDVRGRLLTILTQYDTENGTVKTKRESIYR